MQLYVPNPKFYAGPHYRAPGNGAMSHHPLAGAEGAITNVFSWSGSGTAIQPGQLVRPSLETQERARAAVRAIDRPTPTGKMLRRAAPIAIGAVIVVALLSVFRGS